MTLIDRNLLVSHSVWAWAESPHSVFEIAPVDLAWIADPRCMDPLTCVNY